MSQPFDREPDDLDIAFRAMGDLLAVLGQQVGDSRLIGGLPPQAVWARA